MSPNSFYMHLSWADPKTGRRHERSELPPITFGRRNNNTVVLNEGQVGRLHARLDNVEGKPLLTDLGSINGTRMYGKRIKQVFLKDGDQFQIGAYTITYKMDDSRQVQSRYSKGPSIQCSNPDCNRIVSINYLDCPWCGFALPGGATVKR